MKEFRLKIGIRNNIILKHREKLGLTQPEMALKIGISFPLYNAYECLRENPICKNGRWSSSAKKIADALNLLPEDVWSEAALSINKNKGEVEVGANQLAHYREQLLVESPEDVYEAKLNKEGLHEALASLTTQQVDVLTGRYAEDKTLAEVGEDLNLSRERIRQIEAKALRHLRHPSKLRFFSHEQ